MVKSVFLTLFTLLCINTFAQNNPIYVFDYETGILDSLPPIGFDTTLTYALSEYSIGDFSSSVAMLSSEIPTVDVFPESEFSIRKRAADFYETQDFPIRTTLKISFLDEDGILDNCSGSMISKKHVLSASYCFVAIDNSLTGSEIMVSPIFNDGLMDSSFGSSSVAKIYFAKNGINDGEYMAILELDEPLGIETGYLGVAFDESLVEPVDGLFYKFTYPNGIYPDSGQDQYNGDTLCFFYGVPNITSSNSLGVPSANSFVGEGGSSIIKIENNVEYTSYGVTSFATGLQHNRFTNQSFHIIQEIISEDLVLGLDESSIINYAVWPNPTKDILNVDGVNSRDIFAITIFDSFGKRILANITGSDSKLVIDTSHLRNGMYFLQMETSNGVVSKKFVKL